MPSTLGSVTQITVGDAFGCVSIQPVGAPLATFTLWSLTSQTDDSDRRFANSYYLSLVRDAFINGKKIEVVYNTGSSLVTYMVLKN